ncbi:BZ3500_MvSof-1268-A1-R1_Chr4-3g07278 [Microbotryum saponariae]|uniref:BZ3500_MvSof-1268-A1-R1_Chr4-3g07278 protein n=1 Tax=Microbotryum saponariae TaxID=289078 RepID=A0A2X0LIQ8_9BASI|nr:BZ3500_MvSof-1268-A1-R1_Chr4-3g07278 [Microbotryum saponariae]SDA06941.1 BZ3501_MvSof-1269-A2-R1_Chr4-2g06987 [Microbotryum saponariae]
MVSSLSASSSSSSPSVHTPNDSDSSTPPSPTWHPRTGNSNACLEPTPLEINAPGVNHSGHGAIYRRRQADKSAGSYTSRTPLPPHPSHYDPATLTIAQCQWNDCGRQFYELEPLIEHLHNTHAFPEVGQHQEQQTAQWKGPPMFTCEWTGCPRRGKNQNSRFALVGHLRSHTGEKPFICPRPECDKSFTRTDALQKHMRIQHGDRILPSRKPPLKKRKAATALGARASSVESESGTTLHESNLDEELLPLGPDDGEDLMNTHDVQWSPDELEVFKRHSECSREFLAYVLLKAQWRAALQEQETLASEVEVIGTREAELASQCEDLVRHILQRELQSPQDARIVEFSTAFNHEPPSMPVAWAGESSAAAKTLKS